MSEDPANTAAANHRVLPRRPLKRGVGLTLHKGTLGLGPNLAVDGVELSNDGIQLKVKAELKKGDEVEIGLTGIGRSKPMKLVGEVCWCRPSDDGKGFLVGVQFRHRLTPADMWSVV